MTDWLILAGAAILGFAIGISIGVEIVLWLI
jgi:hypothetical protein